MPVHALNTASKHIRKHVSAQTHKQYAASHINLFSWLRLAKTLSTCLLVSGLGGEMCMWQSLAEHSR